MLIDLLISLACISGGLSFLILIDQYRKEAKDNGAWGMFGDVAHIHEEMRAATRKAGGGTASSSGPVTSDVRTHRGDGV